MNVLVQKDLKGFNLDYLKYSRKDNLAPGLEVACSVANSNNYKKTKVQLVTLH